MTRPVTNPDGQSADGTRDAHRLRRARDRLAGLGSCIGRHWSRPLQRPPLDGKRLHAQRRQPCGAACDERVRRHGSVRRHLLLPGDRRGRRGQCWTSLESGDRHRKRRHPAPDGLGHVAGERQQRRRHRHRHCVRLGQRCGRRRAVPGRRRQPRYRGHDRALCGRLEHRHCGERIPQPDGGRSRCRGEHQHVGRRRGDGRQRRVLGSRRRVRLRRGYGCHGRRQLRQRKRRHRRRS